MGRGGNDACLEYACASLAIVQFDDAQDGLAEPPRRFHERQHGDFDAVLVHIVRNLLGHTREGLDGLAAACQATCGSVQLLIVRRHAHGREGCRQCDGIGLEQQQGVGS